MHNNFLSKRMDGWAVFVYTFNASCSNISQQKKIDGTLIPGGCTKYIQALDVSWNKPFKAIYTKKYDGWLEIVGIHQEIDAGNLKYLPRSTIVN